MRQHPSFRDSLRYVLIRDVCEIEAGRRDIHDISEDADDLSGLIAVGGFRDTIVMRLPIIARHRYLHDAALAGSQNLQVILIILPPEFRVSLKLEVSAADAEIRFMFILEMCLMVGTHITVAALGILEEHEDRHFVNQ